MDLSRQRELLDLTHIHYPRQREEAREACETLLHTPFLVPEIDQAARRNATWYAQPLALLGNRHFRPAPYSTSTEITVERLPGWSLFNPSIAADPQGNLAVIVRSTNYSLSALDDSYQIHGPDQIIRTRNYLGRIDPDTLENERWEEIDDAIVARVRRPFVIQGLEDCRLFWNGGWRFSATVRDLHPSGVAQMVMCGLEGHTITEMEILSDHTRHEKNWMPIIAGWIPCWLYSCSPTMTRYADGDGSWYPAPHVARHFRGGTQVIPVDGMYLCLVHETTWFDDAPRRVYTHRLVELDPHLRITRVSLPFTFHGRGIEFAAGMVRCGDDLVISYGVHDARAFLLRLPVTEARGMLRSIQREDL